MLQSFLQGMLLGYGACVPIGPINILLMNPVPPQAKNYECSTK